MHACRGSHCLSVSVISFGFLWSDERRGEVVGCGLVRTAVWRCSAGFVMGAVVLGVGGGLGIGRGGG